MNMMKKIIIASLCVLISFGTFAQTKAKEDLVSTREYKVGSFADNWFFSVGVGVQTYFAEQYTAGSIVDHFSPAVDLSIGKWFTPVMGVRAQVSGLNVRGYNDATSPYVNLGEIKDGFYKMNYNFLDVHADFLFNIHSQFYRYNKERCYELIPFAGMGWFAVLDDGIVDNEFASNIGIINRFRINDRLDFDIELKTIIMRSAVDGGPVNYKVNMPTSATIGLTYAFGKQTKFKTESLSETAISEKAAVQASKDAEMEHLRNSLEEQKRLNDKAAKALVEEKKRAGQLEDKIESLKKTQGTVADFDTGVKLYFQIGTAKLDELNESNLEYFADLIKNSNKKFTIEGFADSNTGSKSINESLSKRRAEYVYNQLTEKYSISKDLLSIESDVVRAEGNPQLFRMAIIK